MRGNLNKLMNTYGHGEEEIKRRNSNHFRYNIVVEDVINTIYQDRDLFEGIPQLFDYTQN